MYKLGMHCAIVTNGVTIAYAKDATSGMAIVAELNKQVLHVVKCDDRAEYYRNLWQQNAVAINSVKEDLVAVVEIIQHRVQSGNDGLIHVHNTLDRCLKLLKGI